MSRAAERPSFVVSGGGTRSLSVDSLFLPIYLPLYSTSTYGQPLWAYRNPGSEPPVPSLSLLLGLWQTVVTSPFCGHQPHLHVLAVGDESVCPSGRILQHHHNQSILQVSFSGEGSPTACPRLQN